VVSINQPVLKLLTDTEMASRRGFKAGITKARGMVPKHRYTEGSDLSVKERLRRLHSNSIDTLKVLNTYCSILSKQGEDGALQGLTDAEKNYRKSVKRKANQIKKQMTDFTVKFEALSSDIVRTYEKEQGVLLANMDTVSRTNPTWLNIAGLITNPNQAVLAKRAKAVQDGANEKLKKGTPP
jgi:hypothetical protein